MMGNRRLNSYWFSFSPTGDDKIDAILEAVAIAGRAYHNTQHWRDKDEGELSYAEKIQKAANDAAKITTVRAE